MMKNFTPQYLTFMLTKTLLLFLPLALQPFGSPFVPNPLDSDTIDALCHTDSANWYAFKAPTPYILNTTDCQLALASMTDYVRANYADRNVEFRDIHLNPGRTAEEVLPKQFKGPATQCVLTLAMRSAIKHLDVEFEQAPPRGGSDVPRVEGFYSELVKEASKLIHDCQSEWAYHPGKAAGWKAGGEGGAIAVAIWHESSELNRQEVFSSKLQGVAMPAPGSVS